MEEQNFTSKSAFRCCSLSKKKRLLFSPLDDLERIFCSLISLPSVGAFSQMALDMSTNKTTCWQGVSLVPGGLFSFPRQDCNAATASFWQTTHTHAGSWLIISHSPTFFFVNFCGLRNAGHFSPSDCSIHSVRSHLMSLFKLNDSH